MTTSLALPLLWPLLIGLLGTVVFEALLNPRPQPFWRRGMAANSVHLGSWLLLFGIFVLVLQRPWFAVIFILALQLVVVQSSNTKSSTLCEPFICHDFEYFWDALLHPRLYVPFFGTGLAIAASSAGAAAIGGFLYWEPSLITQWGGLPFITHAGLLILSGAALVVLGFRALAPITLNPVEDMDQLGPFASLWAYGIALMRSSPPTPEQSPFYQLSNSLNTASSAPGTSSTLVKNVVLIQSESFFDPRPWYPDIADSLLAHFDATRAEALQHGELTVPAWGANTVRTECAVLTGLTPSVWGPRQFNPYRTLSRHPLPSLAGTFKAAGYRTVCIHPYPASFYMRHKVIPQLGFDQFIDISSFESSDKHGQYIGDLAVARKVGRLLEDSDNRPVFVFVITMENHGPLHLEAPLQESLAAALPTAPWPLPTHLRDLAVYLRHLGEADKMLASVKNALSEAKRPGLLGWYGDHVPILPAAYRYFSPPTGTTPYMIWSTDFQGPSQARRQIQAHMPPDDVSPNQRALAANELGVQLFKQAFGHDISSNVIKAEPEPQEQE
ncbi:LTA synthase family protein [Vreelandella nanhaiensis]|uniref:LTA synthase family protein n=1 Tax=Vreelandella nanhaiensis TaxID=1258546 RepID=A0A3S0WG63_9GAMM|nr:LTA synthase family protein [Halomonas nanhaiensis]RUR28063.1 LTA synthase family protein [Halomonas nanhaiensis]